MVSKVRLYHLVLVVTRQRVLLFSPLETDRWTETETERDRENVCVEHSILPLEIFLSLLLANVLFFINTFQRQGWNKLSTAER